MITQIQVENQIDKVVMPDNYGARIAFVDYDGKKTFNDYKNNKPQNTSDELEFVLKNAPLLVRSVDSLKEWIKYIKST